MTPENKLALRRWILRNLRYLFDWIEDRLHSAEVKLRDDIALRNSLGALNPVLARAKTPDLSGEAPREPKSKGQKRRRRRGISAQAFDLRFSQ
jgi:hypothetical protein